MSALVCVVELESYARDVGEILDSGDQEEVKVYLAENPEAGLVIPGSSGVRKVRWAASGRGKRGGARIIYYFHNLDAPLFLISIFAKNQKTDLAANELKAARQFAETIAQEFKKRR
jgi:hypothetical protein